MQKLAIALGFVLVFTPDCFAAGDWFKSLADSKEKLAKQGLTVEAAYTGEYWTNTQGGTKRDSTYQDNFDLTLTLDTETAGWWEGGTFFVYLLSNGGADRLTGSIVGDVQVVSNIEAPRATRIYELWYEHTVSDDLSVLLGIHDYNSEFNVTEHGGLFINSSFGIQPEVAIGGRPSVFPLAAPAVRLKYDLNEQMQWLFGLYDGDPGDPEVSEHFPRFDFDSNGGLFIASEIAYQHNHPDIPPGAIKFGLWGNTGDFDHTVKTDINGNTIVRQGSFGGYTIIDQWIYQENDEEGLAGFIQLGGAPRQVSAVDFYFGAGLKYTGLIPKRNKDEAGIAIAMASTSNDLVRESSREEEETVLELTYRAHICDNFAIQPDVQYVFNPNGDPAIDDAIVVGVRFELSI